MYPKNDSFVLVSFDNRDEMKKFVSENKRNVYISGMDLTEDKNTIRVNFRDEYSKQQFEALNTVSMLKTPHRVQKKKQTRKAKPMPGDKVKRLGSTKTMLKAGKGKHDCASKVEHAEWGSGVCIREMHAAPDADGNIAWYDVMFEHGLEKGVPTDDLKILVSEMHEDHDHHIEEEEQLDEKLSSVKKTDAPFSVIATKGGRVVGQIHSIEHNEISDAIQMMKADKKGAKISVESKGGKVVHTESRDRFDYLDRQAASQDRDIAAKKFVDALKKAGIKAKYHRSLGKVEVEKGDLRKAQGIGKRLKVDKEGVRIDGTLNRSFKGVFDKNENVNEQPEHEITVGNYTTKFFYMCGSAQKTMKKHANKEGAEQLTKLQDDFYKLEKAAMDAGGASDAQKTRARSLYSSIMSKAKEVGIEGEVGKYMKMHLDSMIKGDPKLGFGRTDINESRFDPSKNPTAKVDKEFDDARNALRKAGIPHMGQRAIGSMNRERNKFRVHPKFEKKARQALKRFPKVGLEINDKMPEQPMKSKREGVEEAVKYPHNMYDPKTGKRYVAKNRQDHMRMSRMGYDHVPKAMNKSTMKEANDPHMVTELYLFITNDSNLNRQMIQSLIKNYRKKLAKGSYDETLAIKGFMNVVNAGIKAYAKEFSVGERLKVSKADRQEVAKKLSTFYRDEIMHGY